MARIWQLGVIPTRPGTYFRTSSDDVVVEGATNGIVALVYQSNWGPLNEVVDLGPEDLNNLSDYVGTGRGYEAARQALIGGAKLLRTVRVGGSGGSSKNDKCSGRNRHHEWRRCCENLCEPLRCADFLCHDKSKFGVGQKASRFICRLQIARKYQLYFGRQ